MLGLFAMVIVGTFSGWLAVYLANRFYETFEERVENLLQGAYIDISIVFIASMLGPSPVLSLLFIFKYAYLAFLDYEEALNGE